MPPKSILEFSMTRLPRGVPAVFARAIVTPALVAVMGMAAVAVAGPADAKVMRHHPAHHGVTPKRHAPTSAYNFPAYIDRGSDRNPGGDNQYFSDTASPTYFNGPNLIGPAYFQRWWSPSN
jgi:hypothetical protein